MAVGVNARTSFSLLFPPILAEYAWDRGVVAGVFSFGFLSSAVASPFVGRMIDRQGPRLVIQIGIVTLALGLSLATLASAPWQFYLTLGALVGIGGNFLGYGVQSVILPNWFARLRGLAIGIAFSGVGIGSIVLLPWMQVMIARDGWRHASLALAIIAVGLLCPLNLVLRKRPQDIGLNPDGDPAPVAGAVARKADNIVDATWAATEWTLARAARTARFWWISLGYFGLLYAWYAVQVHQTKYLTEIGISPIEAAWALGLVSLVGVPGQIIFGAVSDRIRTRMGLGDRMPRLRHLLCGTHRVAGECRSAAALRDDPRTRIPRLLGDLRARPDRCRNLRRAALRCHLWNRDGRRDRRRCRGPMDHRPALRPHRKLCRGVLDRA